MSRQVHTTQTVENTRTQWRQAAVEGVFWWSPGGTSMHNSTFSSKTHWPAGSATPPLHHFHHCGRMVWVGVLFLILGKKVRVSRSHIRMPAEAWTWAGSWPLWDQKGD